jgi:protein-S-isoprenylcysteine O-methyltransferase Ste14
MDAVWLGALAFLIAFGFDLASMAQRTGLKRAILVSACLLFLLAVVVALREPPLFPAPAWVSILGVALSVVGASLLTYSTVIEIPARSTYLAPGAPSQLITTGTYALCRHPGVLWFGLSLLGLLITNRSLALLVAAFVWFGLDILYVWLQDRYFFPRQFPDYPAYRQHTPMLIPTRVSIRRCWQTLPWPRGHSPEQGRPHHPFE